ncbi:hypothetical protein GCM10023238_10500 [Streptomyces heliomycini]
MFTVRPEERGAYQTLFRDRLVARSTRPSPVRPALDLPRTVRSRIVKERGVLTRRRGRGRAERPDPRRAHRPPADGLGRYRLVPGTGQTHQLRVHMNALGVPILGDPLYPR